MEKRFGSEPCPWGIQSKWVTIHSTAVILCPHTYITGSFSQHNSYYIDEKCLMKSELKRISYLFEEGDKGLRDCFEVWCWIVVLWVETSLRKPSPLQQCCLFVTTGSFPFKGKLNEPSSCFLLFVAVQRFSEYTRKPQEYFTNIRG